jgi:uncharacterized protein (DUF58 family)
MRSRKFQGSQILGNRLLRQVRRLHLESRRLVESMLAGNYRSVFKGPGIEFDEVREYVEGDDSRLIDWNVSSRFGNPYTKVFREERELTLFMMVDVSASIFRGAGGENRKEKLGLLFALLTLAAVKNGDKVGAVFFSDKIEDWILPKKGTKHGMRLIQEMLTFRPSGKGSDLAKAARTVGEALKRRGICIILSDFKTSGYAADLSLLARKHDCIAVRIYDPVDESFPPIGMVPIQDPETGKVVLSVGRSKKFRKQYLNYREIQRRQWIRTCRRHGIGTLEINTAEDMVKRLIQYFDRRAR